MDIEETPVPLPSAPSVSIAANITLQPPLSRRGHGPGLILLTSLDVVLSDSSEALDPVPIQKWAEEGYAVVEIKGSKGSNWNASEDVKKGIEILIVLPECDVKDKFGVIGGFEIEVTRVSLIISTVYSASSLVNEKVTTAITDNLNDVAGIVSFGAFAPKVTVPLLQHLVEAPSPKDAGSLNSAYIYPEVAGDNFVHPNHAHYKPSSAAVAHTRSLTFLKKHSIGPIFDLEAIWDEHTEYEFGNRSVANTMGTMVQEPYVNHITTVITTSPRIGNPKLTSLLDDRRNWTKESHQLLQVPFHME